MSRPCLIACLALLAAIQYLTFSDGQLAAQSAVPQAARVRVTPGVVAGLTKAHYASNGTDAEESSRLFGASIQPQPYRDLLRASGSGQDSESRGENGTRADAKQHVLKVVRGPLPSYPKEARRLRVEGDVTLDVTVDRNGDVVKVEVLEGPPQLAKAAQDAVRQWKYEPPKAPAHTPARIHFNLSEGPAAVSAQPGSEGGEHLTLLTQGHAKIPSDPKCQDEGDVTVEVTVGKSGEVLQAKPLSGPECLRPDVVRWVRTFRYSAPANPPATTIFEFGIASPKGTGKPEVAGPPPILNGRRQNPAGSDTTNAPGGVTPPSPVFKPEPTYTREASKAGLQGTVALLVTIDSQGNVSDVRVVKPLGKGLDENAVKAVKSWKFRPAVRDGTPIAARVFVEVAFKLHKGLCE
jgi:TonB family protein